MHKLDADVHGRRLVRREVALRDAALELIMPLVSAALECSQTFAVDTTGDSAALSACWHMLGSPAAFVPRSKELAQTLNDLMESNRTISKGDLLVVVARDASGPFIALLKLEKMLQFEPVYVAPQTDGTWELDIQRNDNGVSAENKPQKCAIIREPAADRAYHVQLHDEQINRKKEIAQFFYRDFLGCELLPTAAQLTVKFCDEAEAWRRKHARQLDRQGIVSFTRALQAHLLSPSVNFEAFAVSALGAAPNQELSIPGLASLLQATVYPDSYEERPPSFEPDRDTAEKLLSTMSFTFGGGVKISGPTSQLLTVIDSTQVDGDDKLGFVLKATSVQRHFRA